MIQWTKLPYLEGGVANDEDCEDFIENGFQVNSNV